MWAGEEWFKRRSSTSLFTAPCACSRRALSPITLATNGPAPVPCNSTKGFFFFLIQYTHTHTHTGRKKIKKKMKASQPHQPFPVPSTCCITQVTNDSCQKFVIRETVSSFLPPHFRSLLPQKQCKKKHKKKT